MKLSDLVTMARTRLLHLALTRETAVRLGDAAQIESIDAEAADTQGTLNRLLTLEE